MQWLLAHLYMIARTTNKAVIHNKYSIRTTTLATGRSASHPGGGEHVQAFKKITTGPTMSNTRLLPK